MHWKRHVILNSRVLYSTFSTFFKPKDKSVKMITQSIGSIGSTDIDLFKSLGNPNRVTTWDMKLPSNAPIYTPVPNEIVHPQTKSTLITNNLPTPPIFGRQNTLDYTLPHLTVEDEKIGPIFNRRKQMGLLELKKLKSLFKLSPSRQYTLEDNTEDIWFEVDSLTHYMEEEKVMNTMENVLKWVLVLMEILNKRTGNYLALDNLSTDVSRDMTQFRKCFVQIHNSYFKKTSSSPTTHKLL